MLSPQEVINAMGLVPSAGQASLTPQELMYEYGLRTERGSTNDTPDGSTGRILTNFVGVTNVPDTIYVYELEYVRHTNTNGYEVQVKNKEERRAIFEALRQNPNYAALQDQTRYVTDYELIWATSPLFGNDITVLPPSAPNLTTRHPVRGVNFTIEWVRIKPNTRQIALNRSVLSLFESTNASNREGDNSDILTRGINAFMTQHARNSLAANRRKLTSTAANKFFLTEGEHQTILEYGTLQAFHSFTVSLRPGTDQLLLNVHVGASPFFVEGNVRTLMRNFERMGKSVQDTFNAFRGKTVVVRTENQPVMHATITEVATAQMASVKTWDQLRTVCNIQNDLYNLQLNVGTKRSLAVGTHQPDYRFVGDMTIVGHFPFRGLLNGDQTTAMLDFTCKLPITNKRLITENGFDLFGINTRPGRDTAGRYGMGVGMSLYKIPARLLAAPTLIYSNHRGTGATKSVAPRVAMWDLREIHFSAVQPLQNIRLLNLGDLYWWNTIRPPGLTDLHGAIRSGFAKLGLARVQNDASILQIDCQPTATDPERGTLTFGDFTEQKLIDYLNQFADAVSPALVLMPLHDYDLYSRIKRVADLTLGRHVVCAVSKKMRDFGSEDRFHNIKGAQHFANIAMKFNLKAAGTNHALSRGSLVDILENATRSSGIGCDTIILGADVAHPSASARPGCPSIAAMVGSVDDQYLKYPGSMRLQVSGQEFITEIYDMAKERLIDWAKNHNDRLPKNILFYRDGVSESQYQGVRTGEIPQLQTAYDAAHAYLLANNPNAPTKADFRLTFVVIGKRHNARFFTDETCQSSTFDSALSRDEMPSQEETGANATWQAQNKTKRKNHNILPGFVVDDFITHPYSNDFYLQSHKPTKGTGRSAHYFVLTNQMRLDADALQGAGPRQSRSGHILAPKTGCPRSTN